MKRLGSSDSLVVPMCPSGWLEEDDDVAEGSVSPVQGGEKKRRLSAEQVRALEKNFEVENKLEPERKARLAQELGLQPRQVAVWFQNRRARWKTKQLERDYGALKSRYDALRLDYDALLRDKDSLLSEVRDLKAKLPMGEESFSSIKEEPVASESENKAAIEEEETIPLIYNKDGSSDSDSSAVLNEHETSPLVSSFNANKNSSFSSPFFYQQNHLLKVEDDEFLAGDEPCSSFFHEEQPPHAVLVLWGRMGIREFGQGGFLQDFCKNQALCSLISKLVSRRGLCKHVQKARGGGSVGGGQNAK